MLIYAANLYTGVLTVWFKNLTLFRLKETKIPENEELERLMQEHMLRPCGALEAATVGWSTINGEEEGPLIQRIDHAVFLRWATTERLLPPAVINEELKERVRQESDKKGRPVRGKERTSLRESIITELLPKAFTRTRHVDLFLDPVSGWMGINVSSLKRGEEVTELLRHTLDSLPIEPPSADRMRELLTDWLRDGSGDGFLLDHECELVDTADNGSIVRVKNTELSSAEVRQHLDHDRQVSKLGVIHKDRLSLVIGDDLILRKLKMTELLSEQMDDHDDDEELADIVEKTILLGQFRELIDDLSQHAKL